MSIVINGNGSIQGISAGGLPDGCITADDLASGVGGKVLQVVSTTKTDTFSSTTTGSWVEVTGLNVTITPSSTSSKVLISGLVNVGNSVGTAFVSVKVQRNGTDISIGDANGSNNRAMTQTDVREWATRAVPINFLDSPSSTSSCQYKVFIISLSSTMSVNHDGENTTGTNHTRCTSTITAMEVAA